MRRRDEMRTVGTSAPGIRGLALVFVAGVTGASADTLAAQVPVEGEVRQIVTLSFVPGRSGEAVEVFRDLAVPIYEGDPALLSFRGFREIESSIPLDLIVVSAFRGMGGMDRHNAALGEAGIGAFYAGILPLVASHTDQFVEMRPELGAGDPSSAARTALVWYRLLPGEGEVFEEALKEVVVPWEEASGTPSATGRFLLSDGWHYLRFLGFESLGDYQDYWTAMRRLPGHPRIAEVTAERRQVIVAPVPELAVR